MIMNKYPISVTITKVGVTVILIIIIMLILVLYYLLLVLYLMLYLLIMLCPYQIVNCSMISNTNHTPSLRFFSW